MAVIFRGCQNLKQAELFNGNFDFFLFESKTTVMFVTSILQNNLSYFLLTKFT